MKITPQEAINGRVLSRNTKLKLLEKQLHSSKNTHKGGKTKKSIKARLNSADISSVRERLFSLTSETDKLI